MRFRPDRRAALLGLVAAAAAPTAFARAAGVNAAPPAGGPAPPDPRGLDAELAELERRSGGRLGVAVFDVRTGALAGRRTDERFPLCSSFKILLAAHVLHRVDRGQERLDRRVRYDRGVLVTHSPVTAPFAGTDGLTIAELCRATTTTSDNAAANLLLEASGGPPALTAFLRGTGDAVTRLDRYELELNDVPPGDARDTTTPAAMARTLARLALGDLLSASSRQLLHEWLVGNRTGDKRLRAGLPTGWIVGNRTGTCNRYTCNDVALCWPPGRSPLVIAAYLADAKAVGGNADERDDVLAEVARAVT